MQESVHSTWPHLSHGTGWDSILMTREVKDAKERFRDPWFGCFLKAFYLHWYQRSINTLKLTSPSDYISATFYLVRVAVWDGIWVTSRWILQFYYRMYCYALTHRQNRKAHDRVGIGNAGTFEPSFTRPLHCLHSVLPRPPVCPFFSFLHITLTRLYICFHICIFYGLDVTFLLEITWPCWIAYIPSRFHFPKNVSISYFLRAGWHSYIPWIFTIHSSADGQPGSFQLLITGNKPVTNTGAQIPHGRVWSSVLCGPILFLRHVWGMWTECGPECSPPPKD